MNASHYLLFELHSIRPRSVYIAVKLGTQIKLKSLIVRTLNGLALTPRPFKVLTINDSPPRPSQAPLRAQSLPDLHI